ncbi:NfeD family protein [Nocardioides terrisoli]|uniref:NfeD family protein n=1 Tax=Nocardioides terrisoli TaxID=3388267 RepID=UPI00287B6A33|nr:NfeD family protein [Nocardioides marmorisolisilvae]
MGWVGDHAWETWLIAAGVLAVLELVSLDLIFIMLAGGALVGGVAAALHAPGAVAVLLALATAVGLLAVLRPGVVKSLHRGPNLRTGTDALIGTRATVLSGLTAHAPGRVKIGGEEWTALPYDEGDTIAAGEIVDVVQIKGATAYVLRVQSIGN